MDEELEEELVSVVGEEERRRVLEDGLDVIEGLEGGREVGKGGNKGSNSLREEEGEEEDDIAPWGSPLTGTSSGSTTDSLTKISVSASHIVGRGWGG